MGVLYPECYTRSVIPGVLYPGPTDRANSLHPVWSGPGGSVIPGVLYPGPTDSAISLHHLCVTSHTPSGLGGCVDVLYVQGALCDCTTRPVTRDVLMGVVMGCSVRLVF